MGEKLFDGGGDVPRQLRSETDFGAADVSVFRQELREGEKFEPFRASRITGVVQEGCVFGIRFGKEVVNAPDEQMVVVNGEGQPIPDIRNDFDAHEAPLVRSVSGLGLLTFLSTFSVVKPPCFSWGIHNRPIVQDQSVFFLKKTLDIFCKLWFNITNTV